MKIPEIKQHVADPGMLPKIAPPTGVEASIYEAIGLRCNFFDPLRATMAKKAGLTRYPDYCDTHGLSHFSTRTLRCQQCMGVPETPRAIAREAGKKFYTTVCAQHGEAGAYVSNGKCHLCFTSAGAERAGRVFILERAAARRAGDKTFPGRCDFHGLTAFSVQHGKCLSCFTSDGSKRIMKRIEP